MISDADEQNFDIFKLINANYDMVLVKIEDKKECKRLKICLKDTRLLYSGDNKEVKLNEDRLFE